MKSGKWTKEELDFLTKNRNYMTIQEISQKLDRNIQSISSKTRTLGIKKRSKDRLGTKINKLTIIANISPTIRKCKCQCGKEIKIHKKRLSGKSAIKSCGCHKKLDTKLIDIKDITPNMYSFRFLFSRYIRNSINHKRIFDLPFDKFIELLTNNCVYCGIEPRPFNAILNQKKLNNEQKQLYWINVNGIDRINSDIGYNEDNVTTCCKECNYSKRNMTLHEWNSYLNRIYNYKSKTTIN